MTSSNSISFARIVNNIKPVPATIHGSQWITLCITNNITINPKTDRALYQRPLSLYGIESSNFPSGTIANSSLKRYFIKTNVAIHATKTIGNILYAKGINAMSKAEPIIKFGGSPTNVATPPVSESSAAAIRYGIAVTLIF